MKLTEFDLKQKEYLFETFNEGVTLKRDFISSQWEALIELSHFMAIRIKRGQKILVCGNGGSASDSIHFTGEMLGRLNMERNPLPAIALTADIASLTAISNDYGYEHVFERQVRGLAESGDILLAISTSGNSKNVINAVQAAQKIGCATIGLLGGDGGALGKICERSLIVNGSKTSSRCQEVHIFILHSLVDLMDRYFLELEAEKDSKLL